VHDGFGVETHTVGEISVLAVRGELDGDSRAPLQEAVLAGLAKGPVVVDLSSATFLGVSVLRSLVECHDTAIEIRRPLVLAAAPSSVERMLSVARAHDNLPLTRSVVAGLDAVRRLDALWNKAAAREGGPRLPGPKRGMGSRVPEL
jgi:anti-anti-sigma factor